VLQELAALTGATPWVVGSMLFFIGVYVLVAVRVFTARPEELDAQARLALEGDEAGPASDPSKARTEA
jgi:hypothetical protein